MTAQTGMVVLAAVLSSAATIGGSAALDAAKPLAYQAIYGQPSQPVCPTSNCPPPPAPPTLATQIVHGRTTKPADQAEWLSTLGLLVGTGAQGAADAISGQKVAQYIGVMQSAGAGTAWALNTDTVRNAIPGGPNSFGGFEGSGTPGRPGAIGTKNGSVGYELDFTNWDADSGPGRGAFTVGEYVHAQGSFTSLGALYLDAAMVPGKKAWHAGLFFNGHDVVAEHAVLDASDAISSYTILGRHQIGFDASSANPDMRAIVLAEGQTACFARTSGCIVFRAGTLRITGRDGNTIFAIDEAGNLEIAGRLTQSAATLRTRR